MHGLRSLRGSLPELPIVDVLLAAAAPSGLRGGACGYRDTEIRDVGAPIVLGTIPSVIGLDAHPRGARDVRLIAKEFAERNYIVLLTGCTAINITGCTAINIASYKDEEGI